MQSGLIFTGIICLSVITMIIPVYAETSVSPSPGSGEKGADVPATVMDNTDYLLTHGLLAYQSGKYSDSQRYFKTVISRDPDNVMAWYYTGMSQYHLNQTDEAMDSFTRVLERDPDYYMAWYGKSLVFYRQGDVWAQSDAISKAQEIETRISGSENSEPEQNNRQSKQDTPLSAGILVFAVMTGIAGLYLTKKG